jgi:hypothetical protein
MESRGSVHALRLKCLTRILSIFRVLPLYFFQPKILGLLLLVQRADNGITLSSERERESI